LALFEDFLVLVEDIVVEDNRELIKCLFWQMSHELNVLQLLSLPFTVHIIILEEVIF
jgi:hypothetical protein